MPKYFPPQTSVEDFKAALRETYGSGEEELYKPRSRKEARQILRDQGLSEAAIKFALGDEDDDDE